MLFGVYVYCPSVITWVSFITGYSLSVFLSGRYLSVCYLACVYQLLVTVCHVLLVGLCPCIVGYCLLVFAFAVFIIRYRLSVILGSVHMLLGLCPAIVGTVCLFVVGGLCSNITGYCLPFTLMVFVHTLLDYYTWKQLSILHTWNTETGNTYLFIIF